MAADESKPSFNILLAEDNDVNRELATRLLERRGHTVESAVDGKEAVDKFKAGAYDVILMDMDMPVMDGVEATCEIRKIEKSKTPPSHIPIIAMTAWDSKEAEMGMKKSGMDGFIAKPINTRELDSDLRAIVDTVRSQH